VTKAVGNAIVEQGEGGRIINISSVAGRRGMPTYGAYAASKAGVIMLTQVLASELASRGVNVNCVCPGLIGTHRMKDIVQPGPLRDAVMGNIPLGREGSPDEIGEMVAFLAGPRAAYIHGQTFNVDGGIVMS
jgi:NAD(P)-dependent dehydrogenase (short-subunit alcohol dehydrogenase family)